MLLFNRIVYGPVHSRRLGISLGVNLSPLDGKICSFNCIYCEIGLNEDRRTKSKPPAREAVKESLIQKLVEMESEGLRPDVITFSGNGEPTMHPAFGGIIEDTIAVRNKYCPEAKIAVLSNSMMIRKQEVFEALCKVDEAIMKFDSALDSRIGQIDDPNIPFCSEQLVEQLSRFNGRLIVQTIFLRGERDGVSVDNTGEEEVIKWLEAVKRMNPRKVMIYTVDRETPVKTLYKVPKEELEIIANRVRKEGFEVSVSG